MIRVANVAKGSIPRPPHRQPISITPAARQRLNTLYSQHNTKTDYIKLSLKSKGCSGNAYNLDWTSKKHPFDEEVSVDKQLSLLIDGKALMTVIGSEMDYVEEKVSSGFVFNNPNATETCGCGQSFKI